MIIMEMNCALYSPIVRHNFLNSIAPPYQSISSAEAGAACSSCETIFPFFTRITTSAILAMF